MLDPLVVLVWFDLRLLDAKLARQSELASPARRSALSPRASDASPGTGAVAGARAIGGKGLAGPRRAAKSAKMEKMFDSRRDRRLFRASGAVSYRTVPRAGSTSRDLAISARLSMNRVHDSIFDL